jgi:hypothetical protein
MTIFIILERTDNGEQFEDYREFTTVLTVHSTREAAEKAIELLPKTAGINYAPVYADHFTGNTSDPEPWFKTDEKGEVLTEPTSFVPITYEIEERELR